MLLIFYYKITVLFKNLLEVYEKSANFSTRRNKDQKDLSALGDHNKFSVQSGVIIGDGDRKQGGKRPGDETGSPLLVQCVMRRRTGTSAPSALPVRLMAAKNFLSTNRKSVHKFFIFEPPVAYF